MKIYLHIGYHKTGSSFLQMMFSTNRTLLKELGIYYPSEDRDNDAKEGRISPGNGLRLSQAITTQNKNEFMDLMSSWIKEAITNECKTLLISNEGLFHSMSSNDYSNFFKELRSKTQISEVQGLLFLRDPLDHIFSLYKHRGKRGTIPDFKTWVNEDYETLQLTEQFINKLDEGTQVNFTLRRYKNDSKYLADAVFKDWLNISTPSIPEGDRVNPSLTLSEIMVLENVYKVMGSEKTIKIQQRFLKNTSSKPKDEELKKYYAHQLKSYLSKHSHLIEKINGKMPKDEKLILENYKPIQNDLKFVVLSSEQLKIVLEESNLTIGLRDKVKEKVKELYRKTRK